MPLYLPPNSNVCILEAGTHYLYILANRNVGMLLVSGQATKDRAAHLINNYSMKKI